MTYFVENLHSHAVSYILRNLDRLHKLKIHKAWVDAKITDANERYYAACTRIGATSDTMETGENGAETKYASYRCAAATVNAIARELHACDASEIALALGGKYYDLCKV